MRFLDEAKIRVKAGDGGNGCATFRREAFVPRGGPSGGDGGRGGNVILVADSQLATLLDYRYKREYKARRGEDGQGRDRYGRGGDDLHLRVPVGTIVYDAETGEALADLKRAGDEFMAARGGHGGRGNIHFATPWNQAPTTSEPGTPGEERLLRLELKLLADVGIIGFPSVGKSTFIARVSRARPKIADYPFTTLVPNLGVVRLDDERTFVVADVPGLIEGAAEGAGLGHRFLRHIERTRALLHIVEDAHWEPGRDPLADFDIVMGELERYSPQLAKRPQIVAMNKADRKDAREAAPVWAEEFAARGVHLHVMSAAAGDGVREVLEALWRLMPARDDEDD
jgi:GTPase